MLSWQVSGGRGGVYARQDDLLTLATAYAAQARALAEVELALGSLVPRSGLAASVLLSPGTGARVLVALARVTVLLLRGASAAEELAVGLRGAIAAYRAADAGLLVALDGAESAAGAAAVRLAVPWVLPLAVGGLALDRLGGLSAISALDAVVARLPGEVGFLAGGAGGILVAPSYLSAMRRLGVLLPDGRASVAWVDATAGSAPRTAGDLLREVDGADGGAIGGIAITCIRGGDGTYRYVVALPGTSRWSLRPGPEPRDLAGDIALSAAHDSAYTEGVLLALAAAGVPPGAPLMLVGHSQGGLAAARLAGDPRLRKAYALQCVLVAGAPLGRARQAPDVPVLALENTADLVPRLEGRPNRDGPDLTTARFTRQTGSVLGNHDLGGYARAADALPRADPSVAAWCTAAAPFLRGGATTRTRWSVRRIPAGVQGGLPRPP